MFGYVCVHSPQLKMWEFELYKNIYCSLCKYGGKRTSKLSRFMLSYDFVALAIARMALTDDKIEFTKAFCPYFPRKKKMLVSNSSLDYTADAFIILTYYKLLDDKVDSSGLKSLMLSVPPEVIKSKAESSMKRHPDLAEIINNSLSRLSKIEKNVNRNEKNFSLDLVADCFAVLLAEILSNGIEGSKKRIAHEIGYHIGRYIYIIDALDDFDKDIKKNNFNPLISIYKNRQNLEKGLNDVVLTLRASMNRVSTALKLIDNENFTGILENISTYGADAVIEKTCAKYKNNK